jgi:hypothetical protein
MQSSSKLPAVIGILLVIGAAFYYYYSYLPSATAPVSPDSSLTVTSSGTSAPGGAVVGSDVLALLNEISGLNIDTSFFRTQVYQSLTDFTVTIPPEPVGKSNPFSPLPGYALPPQAVGTPAGR